MVVDQVDQTIITQESTLAGPTVARPDLAGPFAAGPALAGPVLEPGRDTLRTSSRRITRTAPWRPELTWRIVGLVFGLIQLVIGARIVLLLVGAREANGIVAGISNLSHVFVAPFDGILRTDSFQSAGSVLDLTAVLALVGWTIVELIVFWVAGIFRREPA